MVNKMDFEFIDESEIEYSTTVRVKKTPSLFDSALIDRTYWGDDAGTELAMALARIQIRKSIKNMQLIDVNDHDLTRRLLKEYREELRLYQLEMISILITENTVITVQNSEGDWVLRIV